MMNMISSPGVSAFVWLWIIHSIAVFLSGVGLLLLFVWAIKTFTHHQLKSWGLSLLISGILLCLFTVVMKGGPWIGGGYGYGRMMRGNNMVIKRDMMEQLRDRMMDYNPRSNAAEFEDMREMMEDIMDDQDGRGMMR
ncbi:hypothetical protein HYZ99_05365 [Candidatus Peregrinibacteria bacterium]|nr:hypothetical protein [Candidatus Peregrinibacteria bacterium]